MESTGPLETKDIAKTETDPTFLSRFYLSTDEVYSEKRYLTVIMRTSIFEKIFTSYLFQSTGKDFSLYEFLCNIKDSDAEMQKFISRLKLIESSFSEEGPLFFFNELSKEIQKILKEDISKIKFDKFILKIEFLLAWHFENNFYEKQIDAKMNTNFYDTMYLQKIRTNFNYSIECLSTIFHFLKVFEKQALSTKLDNDFVNNHDLYCTEKIYYYFCDKVGKEKIPSGSIVEYLIRQLMKKFESLKNAKVNNIQIEQYILMNLFIISKIVSEYSFYFSKKPELESFFYSLKSLKAWPIPVGNFVNDVLETLINECSFQGISVINRLRELYFIDFLDPNVIDIETKYFRSTLLIYSDEWDKRNYASINSENPNGFNLIKFLGRLVKKEEEKEESGARIQNFSLREFVVRIFITFIFNSRQEYSDDVFLKLYNNFYPEPFVPKQDGEEAKSDENLYGNTKNSLDMLLKLIDVGFDKTIDDFDKEINIVASKLIQMEKKSNPNVVDNDDTIVTNSFYQPVTYMRNYLKPHYSQVKKIFKDMSQNADIFDIYLKNFEYVIKTYFPHFLTVCEDPMVEENLKSLRSKFYLNYKVNIVLIEEGGTINDFISVVTESYPKYLESKITDEEYENFWKYFVDKKSDLECKFLLHVVPHLEKYEENPFRFITEKDELENESMLLSEFIAYNDNIYKNLVFMPWASKCDSTFYSFVPNCQLSKENVMQFPPLDIMYSFLKKPLDYYLSDSTGILNLDIYRMSINNNLNLGCVFWKNLTITMNEASKTKITMFCVDYLGVEYKEEKKVEITITTPFLLKIFNLFSKKDVPFNYNMVSNNGWLEVFLCDKYNKEEIDKLMSYTQFVKNSIDGKYYEEFNVPQMDLETVFRNFKVKTMTIETNKNTFSIKYDDTMDFSGKDKIKAIDKGDIKIAIGEYEKDGKKITLPVASFISI